MSILLSVCDLDLYLLTLIFKIDLDMTRMYGPVKNKVLYKLLQSQNPYAHKDTQSTDMAKTLP